MVIALIASGIAHKNRSTRDTDRGIITLGWFAAVYVAIFAGVLLAASFYGAGKWISTGNPPSPIVATGIVIYGSALAILWARARADIVLMRVDR